MVLSIFFITSHTAHSVGGILQKGCVYVAVECRTGADIGGFLQHSQQSCGAILHGKVTAKFLQRFRNGHTAFHKFSSNGCATFRRFSSNGH